MLICVEGLTNAGKTTICRLLAKNKHFVFINDLLREDIVLKNVAKITNPIANLGRFNSRTELLLYLSMLSQKAQYIENLCSSKDILLVDRFSLSILAQFSDDSELSVDYLKYLVNYATKSIIPDYTFFLDVKLNTIIKRTMSSPFSRKDSKLLSQYENMRKIYLDNLSRYSSDYLIVDCEAFDSPEKMVEEIMLRIQNELLCNDFRIDF